MYNIKKMFRQKSNIIITIIFVLIFIILLFLFKYLFVVQDSIEKEIYDQYKNLDVIVYNNLDNLKEKIKNIEDIEFAYNDYQLLEVTNELFGRFEVKPLPIKNMPSLSNGSYPSLDNEILLPNDILVDGKKYDLTMYLGKDIEFILNNSTKISLYVTGIYEADSPISIIYYNLNNINYLLEKTNKENYTEFTRIVINHYKNLDSILFQLNEGGNLYNPSGLDEIQFYEGTFNTILFCVIICISFTFIVVLVVLNIIYHSTKNQIFICYVLGCTKLKLVQIILSTNMFILLISNVVSFLVYLLSLFLLRDMFKDIFNTTFLKLVDWNGSLIILGCNVVFLMFIFLIVFLIVYRKITKDYY